MLKVTANTGVQRKKGADNQPDTTKPEFISLKVKDASQETDDTDTSEGLTANIIQTSVRDAQGKHLRFTWGSKTPDYIANKYKVGSEVAGCIIPRSALRGEILPRMFKDRNGVERWALTRNVVCLGINNPTPAQVEEICRKQGFARPSAELLAITNAKMKAHLDAQQAALAGAAPAVPAQAEVKADAMNA